MRVTGLYRFVRCGLFCVMALFLCAGSSRAQSAVGGMALPSYPSGAIDSGALPGTQVVTLTLYLAPPADRAAALDAFLAAVQSSSSPQYRQWLTPASFAQSFGATADQLAAVQAWAAQQGLKVGTAAASGTFVTVSGTAAQIEAALAPGLHAMQMNGQRYVANTALPTLPAAVAANVLAIDGLDTLPSARTSSLRTEAGRFTASDLLAGVSSVVEANSTRLLSIASTACVEDVDAATAAAMHLLLKEAAAEGITTLAASGCNGRGAASYPGGLAELVSAAAAPGITPATAPVLTEARPEWQNASGLPQDGFRYEPDLTVSSLADLESAVVTILSKQPALADGSTARLGNIAGTLYTMGPIPGVYTQADGAAAGTWEAATGLGVADLGALAKHFPNGVTASTVTIAPSAGVYSITYLGDAAYTITVSGTAGAPTGSVNVVFSPGGYSKTVALTAATATSSTATFSLDQLATQPAAGQSGTQYSIAAVYSGDGTYAQTTSSPTSLYVNPQQITTSSAASSNGQLFVGGTYTVSVSFKGGSGQPTGTLTITPTPGTPQTSTFATVNGNATQTFTATQAGTISISVACSTTDPSYLCYGSSTSQYVSKATPTVSGVQVSPNPLVPGQSATLSATVTGAGGSAVLPSGTVSFKDANGNALCTTNSSTAISGSVSCQASNLAASTSGTVTATYNGDNNYNTASSSASYTGTQITTSLVLSVNKSAVVVGGQVTLTAVITPATALNNTPLSGTVTFYDAAGQVGAAQQVTPYYSTVTYTVALPTQGSQSIYAKYSGDTNYSGNTSNSVPVLVGPATAVTFTASPTGNVTYGVPVTFTANITGTPTDGTNALSGSVTFNIYGTTTLMQQVQVTSTGTTTATAVLLENQALAAGSYRVQLSCQGTTNFDCNSISNSATYTFNVTPETPTVTVTLNPNTTAGGTTVAATATITPAATSTDTGLVIGGTVTFYDNGTAYGPYGVNNNQATATFTLSAAGGDNIVAVYSGDANNKSVNSVGTGGGSGTPVATSITVGAAPATALAGAPIKLTAMVTATPATGTTTAGSPTGTVYFYATNSSGTQFTINTAVLVATGINTSMASVSTTQLAAGNYVITAAFVGTGSYTSSATAVGVPVQITDYTVMFSPTSLNLNAGDTKTVTAAVNAVNGFAGQVSLGCTAPAGSAITCSFDHSPITLPATAPVLTITTTTRAAVRVSSTTVEAEAGAAGALLFCLLLPAARRRKMRLLALVAFAVLGSTLGCTNLVNPPTGSGLGSGTPAGTLVLTISTSGTDGVTRVEHDYTFPITVQ